MRRGRQAAAIGLVGIAIAGGIALPHRDAVALQGSSTPTVAECTVAPLTSPIWDGTEIAEPTAPVSIAGPFTPPTGVVTDDATLAAVSRTVSESIACQNDGDVARTLALFTPDAVRAFFSGPRGYDADSVDATFAAGPVPVNDDRVVELVGIDEVVLLEDGRAGATVTTAIGETEYIDFLFFVEGTAPDGVSRWLIDGSVAIDTQTQVEGDATEIP